MTNTELIGSTKALLDEYKKAIDELIFIIKHLTIMFFRQSLTAKLKTQTANPYKQF